MVPISSGKSSTFWVCVWNAELWRGVDSGWPGWLALSPSPTARELVWNNVQGPTAPLGVQTAGGGGWELAPAHPHSPLPGTVSVTARSDPPHACPVLFPHVRVLGASCLPGRQALLLHPSPPRYPAAACLLHTVALAVRACVARGHPSMSLLTTSCDDRVSPLTSHTFQAQVCVTDPLS